MNQPIKVRGHSLIDYGFVGLTVAGPLALRFEGAARALPVAFAAAQGSLNALTDQPYALSRRVSFQLHGRAESVAVPGLAIAAYRSGMLSQPRTRLFFTTLLTALGVVYTLTDWGAAESD